MLKNGREYRNINGVLVPNEESADSSALVLRGTPVVFETPTCLYEWDGVKYYEVIDRHAFDECDFSDFIFNYNHGGRVYARNRNGTLKHEITESGIDCTISLNGEDEGHRQLYRDVKSELIDKMSFSFSIREASYDSQTRTRRITKVKKLYDFSAVDFPAYEETAISARGFFEEEHSKAFKAMEQAEARKKLIAKTYLF